MIGVDYNYFKQGGTSPYERWYPAGVGNGFTNYNVNSRVRNTLYAVPWVEGRGTRYTGIGFYQGISLGSSGAKARLGIYNVAAFNNIYPGNLVLDAGELAIDSGASSAKKLVIDVTLNSDSLYWLVFVYGGSSDITIRTVPPSNSIIIGGVSPTNFGVYQVGYQVSFTYAALPSTFPGGATWTTGTITTDENPLIALGPAESPC